MRVANELRTTMPKDPTWSEQHQEIRCLREVIATLNAELKARNAELETLRTESAERARVDMATIERLESEKEYAIARGEALTITVNNLTKEAFSCEGELTDLRAERDELTRIVADEVVAAEWQKRFAELTALQSVTQKISDTRNANFQALAKEYREVRDGAVQYMDALRLTGEMVDLLEIQSDEHTWSHFAEIEDHKETLERLSEVRSTVELLYSENARLQRQVDEADARNLKLLKERAEIHEELDTEEEAAAFMHTRISELLGVKRSLEKRIAELEATQAVER
jgi:chromosome segregation ATPase